MVLVYIHHTYTLTLTHVTRCPNRKATAPSSAKDYNVRIIYKQSCNSTVNLTDSTIFHFHSSIKPSYGTASFHLRHSTHPLSLALGWWKFLHTAELYLSLALCCLPRCYCSSCCRFSQETPDRQWAWGHFAPRTKCWVLLGNDHNLKQT